MTKDFKGADGILGLTEITDDNSIWRMLMAELIGTFLLVVIGCASIIHLDNQSASVVQIALTFGLTIATIVQCIGHVSGGHINPAVTFSFFATGHIKLVKTLCFVIVQCAGAAAGAAVLRLITPTNREGELGITKLNPQLTDLQGFVMEALLTFFFLFVIHAVCDARRNDVKGSGPLAIGLCITACHLAAVQYTGSSLNPARSFGPAVIMNLWENHWVYWAGPIIGGVLAGLVYKMVFKAKKGDDDSYDL